MARNSLTLRGCACLVIAALAACDESATTSTGEASPSGSAGVGETPAPSGPRAATREGSTVVRAPDSSALFVADEDAAALHVLALPISDDATAKTVTLPGKPAQLLVTDRHVLVTIRDLPEGGGALLWLDRHSHAEVGRVVLPADAWGLALSPDESFALVSSAWTARVSAIDLATSKLRFSIEVAREPRGITIVADGSRAYVAHLTGSAVTRIDGIAGDAPQHKRIELPPAPARTPIGGKVGASLGYVALALPEGVMFPRHALGALGGDAWQGTAAVDVLDEKDEPLAPARRPGMPRTQTESFTEITTMQPWLPGADAATATGADAFIQPRAAIYRKKEQTLLVASEGTDTVVELDATMMDPTLGVIRSYAVGHHGDRIYDIATEGGAPSGIALSEDENTAFVHCRSTRDLAVVQLVRGEGIYRSLPPTVIALGPRDEDESLSIGRRLFYNATDSATSGGLGCAGCHPDGRDDGHVWHETIFGDPSDAGPPSPEDENSFANFIAGAEQASSLVSRWPMHAIANGEGAAVGYARQTPMLAGRTRAMGPYGWHSESKDLVARIVAGFGLHRWRGQSDMHTSGNLVARASHLARFVRDGLVAPAKLGRELNADELRGKEIFESKNAGCTGCHPVDSDYTDRVAIALARRPPTTGFAAEKLAEFKTPSLLHVGGTAPYFHDGRFESLESLVEKSGDTMGKMSHLTPEDRRALIAFLRTL